MAVKGKTNNPNGRPKGSKNKVTTEVRDWISKVIDKQRPQLEKDLRLLEPAERWRIIEKLMSYVVPKMQAVEANVNLNKLSDEDLDKLASNIIKASEEVTDEN